MFHLTETFPKNETENTGGQIDKQQLMFSLIYQNIIAGVITEGYNINWKELEWSQFEKSHLKLEHNTPVNYTDRLGMKLCRYFAYK